jgi:hypothetical protein
MKLVGRDFLAIPSNLLNYLLFAEPFSQGDAAKAF